MRSTKSPATGGLRAFIAGPPLLHAKRVDRRRAGQIAIPLELVYERPGGYKSRMAKRIEILLEDEDLIAVNKPAGLLTVPGRKGGVALREVIALAAGIKDFLLLVHRLDRQTSGVLLLAKHSDAQRNLQKQFQERRVHKEYLAIVRGQPVEDRGRIELLMAPHTRVTGKMVVKQNKGKHSTTDWEVAERFEGAALLRCHPLTGRQHQIRVHLAHIGLPLLVDPLYGDCEAFYLSQLKPGYRPSTRHEERPLIERLTLHAQVLALAHPRDGRPIRIEAAPPKDFRAAVEQLRKVRRSKAEWRQA